MLPDAPVLAVFLTAAVMATPAPGSDSLTVAARRAPLGHSPRSREVDSTQAPPQSDDRRWVAGPRRTPVGVRMNSSKS